MKSPESLPNSINLPFVERLYSDYKSDPASVTDEWRRYFAALENGDGAANVKLGPSFRPASLFHSGAGARGVAGLQDRVLQLVRAYRLRGHMAARFDPLGRVRPVPPELDPAYYHFTAGDLRQHLSTETMPFGDGLTLAEIVQRLRNTYCRSIGVEYMHIDDVHTRRWLQARMERTENHITLTRAEQLRILTRLTYASVFEEFVRKKFIGAKSFSLEGSESLIPLLDLAIEKAGEQGVSEIVLGMAHRGRLNVLANILGKPARQIFREFTDSDHEQYTGRGDVKYHLGFSSDWETSSGNSIHLSLCFNPSHLEFVNAVALGRVRAKQDRVNDAHGERGLPILIHGDAAVAGEGVVQETLNMSQLSGYSVGGTLHVVVNNQIGFTTGPEEGRSTSYATDIFKMLQVPIFHVNGEDPEAVAQCVRLSLDFRAQYRRDVVIDMYGYRRHGHNEADEPAFTQPLLYQAISERMSVREGYLDHLLQYGGVSLEQAEEIASAHRNHLERQLAEAKAPEYRAPIEQRHGAWAGYTGGAEENVSEVPTGVAAERLAELLEAQTRLPEHFKPHLKIRKLLDARREMARGNAPLDWSAAESLALATLAVANHPVRLSGQDSERGTFSHRHAVLHDFDTGERYVPLQHLAPDQAPVRLINSPLSETGVLGFDYGYSLDAPEALVMWEAQFGDFWNAAQVIVDQFIASAEAKWKRLSGVVLLLPHGFEGAGPEHSSARIERFLAMAAEDNIQVVNPTTPAQLFHLLRRQVLRPWRKPLVVLTPKSLLRHPRVVSPLIDLADGGFQRILSDTDPRRSDVRRVLLCSGKIYYELEKYRDQQGRNDVAILRVEQLYPLREEHFAAALDPFLDGTPVFWVQEEPHNMGAWRYMLVCFGERLLGRLPFSGITRPPAASPATGSHSSHEREQAEIIERAFNSK
ncbi:MAG TPA: 2-oxoglutarate dehydrogenase E1 component [Methylomirabilota bacterium]|nr:2-oxoglutarate dehydrogenase E1 component [Methylomirabilota bacterium]